MKSLFEVGVREEGGRRKEGRTGFDLKSNNPNQKGGEVGVLGLNSRRGWRWRVCRSNAGAIEVGAMEVGVFGLSNGRGPAVECLIQMLEL